MLKLIVDFGTLLIGVAGTRSSRMHSHFLHAVFIQGSWFNVLREAPQAFMSRRLPDRPRTLSAWSGNQQAAKGKIKMKASIAFFWS
ncbi:Secreted protein [Cytobacillus oceanisediminis]|uniref:Uncharacterized protein n=1 Tax=Cytobacillus oceanisediminis TaxID=665099 RepID=A0A562K0Z0_9BACI|nr:hypothetical protein IQ19_01516 [Cytobacillus oceanisediminis]